MNFPIVVLISGRGSNMLALHNAAKSYEIAAVISNNPAAVGLKEAHCRGLKTIALPRSDFSSVAEQKKAIFSAVLQCNPCLVALAGYMQIVEPYFVAQFSDRLVNIHPALLPKYPGLDTHKRVLAAGDLQHGCTVHLVDAGVDTGAVIASAKIAVLSQDTEESLTERVLGREHSIYPWVVNNIANGRITICGKQILFTEDLIVEARDHQFDLPDQCRS